MADKGILRLAKKIQTNTKKAVVIYKQEFGGIIGSENYPIMKFEPQDGEDSPLTFVGELVDVL